MYLCPNNGPILNMKKTIYLILLLALGSLQIMAQADKACPMIKIEPEHLPDLNIARSGHSILIAGNEIIVFGGHTSGFIPTPTAEYYSEGEWHLIDMVYPHDGGFAIPLKSGEIIIAGGFEKHLGIGQTFVVERYDPQKHSFEGFGCLDTKRAMGVGTELDNGNVVIAGNWYHDDNIELYDGKNTFSFIKNVTVERAKPHIFQMAPDNVFILGSESTRNFPEKQIINSALVDRLGGDTLHVSLFEQWHPFAFDAAHQCESEFIGDKQKELYAYLFTVENAEGNIAICQMIDSTFSLLPTKSAIPMRSKLGKKIIYTSSVIVDRNRQCGYITGLDEDNRQYILRVEYGKIPAPITLFYTDPMPDAGSRAPILTAEGDLMIAGGINYKHNNYSPCSTVLLYHFGTQHTAGGKFTGVYLIIIACVLILICGMGIWLMRRNKKKNYQELTASANKARQEYSTQNLMERIDNLINGEMIYLHQGLKVSDVATLLETSSRNISETIKQQRGVNFNDFINGYRVEHAKQLLEQNPDMKSEVVGLSSGFASETSFYRTFRAMTGKSPKEWAK